MRFKATTWILVAALAAIAAYYFLVEERARERAERARLEGKKLFLYEPRDIGRFTLVNPQGERVEAAQGIAGEWTIVSPVEAPGDNPTINAFIGQVVPGRRGEEIAEARSLDVYGLAAPFATLIIVPRDTTAAPDTLFIGDKTPTSSNSYVRIGSSGPVLISSEITHNVMNKNLYHLRDKNFFAFDAESIGGLAVRGGAARDLRLRRDGRYWWFSGRPVRADRVKIESYINSLTQAIVREFVREDADTLSPYGLGASARSLAVTRGSETMHIFFGSPQGDKVYALRDGLAKVVLLENRFLEAFDWTAENLRAMNLAFFDEDSVRTIRYETPDTSLVLRRAGTKWSTAEADSTELRSWEVNSLLRKLTGTAFEKIVVEPLPAGDRRLESPRLRITLENAVGEPLDVVTILGPADALERGASTSANCIGTLPAGAFEAIHAIFMRIGGRDPGGS